tara:strand:+ start:228 stop:1169 length:942 start_codon:yes stop_codon:yes gene_type:complete
MKLIVNESQYDKLLVEQRGFSKVADDWAHIIVAEVMRYLFRIEGEDTLLMDKLSLKFGDKKFFKKLPISNVIINVSANVIEGTEGGADASYSPSYSHIETDKMTSGGEVIEDVEFNLNIDIPESVDLEHDYAPIHDYLLQMFTHELLHVYEWYNRGLKDPAEKKDCMWMFSEGDINGNIVDRIAYLIYTQQSFEINAFIHQAAKMLQMRDIKDYDQFMDELQSLFVWDFVEGMLNFDTKEALTDIEALGDDEKQRLNNIKLCYYAAQNGEELEVKEKSLKYSDERFLKDLKQRFQVRGLGMKKKLYKLITDIL